MESPVRIVVGAVHPLAPAGHWVVTWEVFNVTDQVLGLEDAWIPHGRFRGEGHVGLEVTLEPGPGERTLSLNVSALEQPGTMVENAFLILRVRSAECAWRVFARMRVTFDAAGAPSPSIVAVTAQSLH